MRSAQTLFSLGLLLSSALAETESQKNTLFFEPAPHTAWHKNPLFLLGVWLVAMVIICKTPCLCLEENEPDDDMSRLFQSLEARRRG